MKINGKPLYLFDAIFVGFPYTPTSLTVNKFQPAGNKELLLGVTPQRQLRTLRLVFHSGFKMSQFVDQLTDEAIIDIADGYLYFCYLDSAKAPLITHKGRDIYEAEFYLQTEMRSLKQSVKVIGNRFFVSGNQRTEAIYIVLPKVNLDAVTIDNVTIHSLAAGKQVVVDGKAKSILEEGINKFSDCELLTFPMLIPGWNGVTTSATAEQAEITCEFWPLWL